MTADRRTYTVEGIRCVLRERETRILVERTCGRYGAWILLVRCHTPGSGPAWTVGECEAERPRRRSRARRCAAMRSAVVRRREPRDE